MVNSTNGSFCLGEDLFENAFEDFFEKACEDLFQDSEFFKMLLPLRSGSIAANFVQNKLEDDG